jgi:serine/threonine protein kinase
LQELIPEHANTFVLKTYTSKDAEKDYTNEVAALQRLNGNKNFRDASYIIGYYGSFVLGETRHILLEYADKGDLERYFMEVLPPDNGEDILSFWEGMSNIVRALMDIHTTRHQSSLDAPVFQGQVSPCFKNIRLELTEKLRLHQDVKPQNILVVSNEDALPYKWQFKLGDFGLSQFKKLTSPQDGTALDAQGTRTYGKCI